MAVHFSEGQLALGIDRRGRRYLMRLGTGKTFQSHLGQIPHDDIIGSEDGCRLQTHSGRELVFIKPGLADYVLEMPRNSQIIYPKDIGPILVHADVYPGAVVVEAGIGSGALTLALLRAVGSMGRVVNYEVRGDMIENAKRNIEGFVPNLGNLLLREGDIYEGIEEREVDRLILDVPEPWRAIAVAGEALRNGGVFLSYLPTVLQVHQLYEALVADPRFDLIESFEVLHRPWHLGPTSARPAHRMVAHTGFLTKALRCEPRSA